MDKVEKEIFDAVSVKMDFIDKRNTLMYLYHHNLITRSELKRELKNLGMVVKDVSIQQQRE